MAISLACLILLFLIGLAGWSVFSSSVSPDRLLELARQARQRKQFDEAESLAVSAWKHDPQLSEALLLAGECAATQSEWSRAVEHFGHVIAGDARLRIAAHLREAEIRHRRLHQIAQAERAYRLVLGIDPDNSTANDGLAQLLFMCGRKYEGIPLVLRLIRQNVDTDMLLLLSRGSMVVNDLEFLKQARVADPTDPNPYVGLAWHSMQDDQFEEAEQLLRAALKCDPVNIPARIMLGELLLSANRTSEFADWLAQLPPTSEQVANIWQLRGQMAESIGDGRGAIPSYWQAARLVPESKSTTFRLAHCLAVEGNAAGAEAFRETLTRMQALEEIQNRTLFAAGRGQPELLWPLAQAYESAGRLWEAYGWCQFALSVGADNTDLTSHLEDLRRRVQKEPLQLVTNSANVAMKIDLSHYPVSDLRVKSRSRLKLAERRNSNLAFRDDAESTGLHFQYFTGVKGSPTHRMFEFTGGGIAVIDYDLDAYPDLYFTQGCSWPPGSSDASGGDRLIRNRGGLRFEDRSLAAGIVETGFGQGVTVGDFDADGFPDVYVANIGRNRLWRNRGDGTFEEVAEFAGLNAEDWTTSTVMVDFTGDGLPDIYDVNYVVDGDVFKRVCQASDGYPALCLPSSFPAQADRLWRNLGDGRFEDATAEWMGEIPRGKGLGVAVWDADGQGRLSLFVANDTTPCFFFRPEMQANQLSGLKERALEAGVAFNGAGKATGCMGIAVGDLDNNGQMDLLITNFYAEPNSLFINTAPGFYEDQTRRRGLEAPSLNLLGFGTQFLDADLDGQLELFVTNGHVDDLSRLKRPYRMPPQLFQMDPDGRFMELPKERLGSYFQKDWLGRAAARLDWNRDGKDDLVVGHLSDPVALLSNTSDSAGSSLSIRLVGIQSNRDAIGTIVKARFGTMTLTRQLTAGDGYQCSNERRLIFGAGMASLIDELTVHWPSGQVQRFPNVKIPAEFCIREGDQIVTESVSDLE